MYQAWKTLGEGEGLEDSLEALQVHLLLQVGRLEVRGGSHQGGDPSGCGGNRQDGVRWGRCAGGRRRGRGGEETLEEAAQGKREDLEKHNQNQTSFSIGGGLYISCIHNTIHLHAQTSDSDDDIERTVAKRVKREGKTTYKRSGKEFTESKLYNSDFTTTAAAPFLTISSGGSS